MPHQCVRCRKFYEDGSDELLRGCHCGGKLFFFIKQEQMKSLKEMDKKISLSDGDKKQIEEDVFDLVGQEIDRDEPVVLDIEAIKVLQPGKYELDLVHLFKGEPLIFKLEDGKYMIDLVQSFKKLKK